MTGPPASRSLLDGALGGLEDVEVLLVASYGRAGSSRLMELLRLTDQAMVAGRFPYETRSVQTGIVLASGVGTVDDVGVVRFAGVDYVPERRRRAGESEAQFRDAVVAQRSYLWPYAAGHGVASLRIAEKAIGLGIVDHVLSTCRRARVVVLDRDPRDVFVSVLHMNRRRGYIGFGAESGPDELARRIASYYREAARVLERAGERASTVDYARLLADPLGVVGAVSRTVPAALDPGRLDVVTAPEHVTSETTEQSLGRWRSEQREWTQQFALLEQAHRDFLDQVSSSDGRSGDGGR